MSTISNPQQKLVLRNVFGFNKKQQQNTGNVFTVMDSQNVLYESGNQIITLNIETKEQEFYHTGNLNASLGITATSYSSARKLLCIAENSKSGNTITLYNTTNRTRRKISAETQEVCCMAFSSDGNKLAIQNKCPDGRLVIWDIEKTPKQISTIHTVNSDDFTVNQISISPYDSNIIVVIGNSILKLFRLNEFQLRGSTIRRDQINYKSHCWIDADTFIVGSDSGELYVIENFECKLTVSVAKEVGCDDALPVFSVVPTLKRGFIAGHSDGRITIFEIQDSKDITVTLKATFKFPGNDVFAILCLGIMNETNLVVATSSQQLLSLPIESIEQAKDNLAIEPILSDFHYNYSNGNSAITGIATSVLKPYEIITCGQDKTIRLWNINKRKVEYTTRVNEVPNILTVHPAGLLIAVSYETSICVYSVLLKNFHPIIKLPVRLCTALAYSTGGQFLCAAGGSTIHIFETYTGKLIHSLRGHGNRIRSIVWSENDNRIISHGFEGSVYCWNLLTQEKIFEHNLPTTTVLSGTAFKDCSYAYCGCVDKKVKKISLECTTNINSAICQANNQPMPGREQRRRASAIAEVDGLGNVPGSIEMSASIGPSLNDDSLATGLDTSSTLSIHSHFSRSIATTNLPKSSEIVLDKFPSLMLIDESRNLLIIATGIEAKSGSVIASSTCFDGPVLRSTFHDAPITSMCLSSTGSLLYTGDECGCLVVSEFSVDGPNGSLGKGQRSVLANTSLELVDEVLVRETDLERSKIELFDLEKQVTDLTFKNNNELRVKDVEYEHTTRDMIGKFNDELRRLNAEYHSALSAKLKAEDSFHESIDQEQQRQEKLKKTAESSHDTRMETEKNKIFRLNLEISKAEESWKEENGQLSASFEERMRSISNDYEEKLLREQAIKKRLQDEKISFQAAALEQQNLIKQDAEAEIRDIRSSFEAKLKADEAIVADLTIKNAEAKKDLNAVIRDAQRRKDAIAARKEKEKRLNDNIASLERDIQSEKKNIREREEMAVEKEKLIAELKNTNEELEKFRFVLDYKIKELKQQIAPSEAELFALKRQHEEMSCEAEQYSKSRQALGVMISELKLKHSGLQHEFKSQQRRIEVHKAFILSYQQDLKDLYHVQNDYIKMKPILVNLFRKYVQGSFPPVDPLVMAAGENDAATSTNTATSTTVAKNSLSPQDKYNVERQLMEKNVLSLHRIMQTNKRSIKYDLGRKLRDRKELIAELDILLRDAQLFASQKNYIEETIAKHGDSQLSVLDLQKLMTLLGYGSKTILPITGFSEKPTSKLYTSVFLTGVDIEARQPEKTVSNEYNNSEVNGHNNTWDEVERQSVVIRLLEGRVEHLCAQLKLDSGQVFRRIDAQFLNLSHS